MDIFILRDGEQTGPFSEPTVQQLLKQGGLRPKDMAWRKGLPAWLPISEVMNPGTEKLSEPPPVMQVSGVNAAAPSTKTPTAKQKALLKYLGVEIPENATKEGAAVLLSDALESPKLQVRLAKWNDEKFRLHGDVFADEIEHRKANRSNFYVELCQTQGEGVVKDVTKAHCQVLVESLDKRFPSWEANSKDALWHYLFPAIAEHFPMLVQDEWKAKLRFGSAPKNPPASSSRTAGSSSKTSEAAPQPMQAAFRGIVYGLAALGLIIGVMKVIEPAKMEAPAPNPAAANKPVDPPPLPSTPAIPADPPLIAAVTPDLPPEPATPVPVETPAPAPAPAPEPAPTPAAPPMTETPPVPVVPAPVPVNPVPIGAPTLPRVDGTSAPAPTLAGVPAAPVPSIAPATPATPKSELTLNKPVNIQLQFGKVTLPPGTRVRFLGVTPAGLKCNFNNNIIVVPPTSTDYDGSLVPTMSNPPASPAAPAAPNSLPPATPPMRKPPTPSSDL